MKNYFHSNRTLEDFAAYWDTMIAPLRPSEEMMEIYDRFLRRYNLHETGTWGLLGCTPEIRSLAGAYGREMVCMDKSAIAYEAFKCLCQPSIDESFIESDWVEIDCPDCFDMVLGDGSIAMLPKDNHEEFIRNLHKMIRGNGIALLRIQVRDGCRFKNPEDVMGWFHSQEWQESFVVYIRSFLKILWADSQTGDILEDDYQSKLDDLHRRGHLTTWERQSFIGKNPMKLTLNFTTREAFEELISPYFEVLGVKEASDFPSSENYPIYALRKKTL